jgi:hypothetical protein
MSRDLVPEERRALRRYYGAMRGRTDGWEDEFDRLSPEALDAIRRRRNADLDRVKNLDAEILLLWATFDPGDPSHVARFDGLLEKRAGVPARMLNPTIVEIERARQAQRKAELRARRERFAEIAQNYAPRARAGLRAHYDPCIALFRPGWGDSIYD